MDLSDTIKKFEAMTRMYNEKKPLSALYQSVENDSIRLPSEVKPEDVIASVSKQLGDMQKADSFKNIHLKHIVHARQTDFVPINALSYTEGFQHDYATKFETQCVTDTQLIDIIDNVEAMVNVNVDLSQDIQRNLGHTLENSKCNTNDGNNITRLCSQNECVNTETNVNTTHNDNTQYLNEKEFYVDKLSKDIHKNFEISYIAPNIDNTSKGNCEIETTAQSCCDIQRSDIDYTNKSVVKQIYKYKDDKVANIVRENISEINNTTNKQVCSCLETNICLYSHLNTNSENSFSGEKNNESKSVLETSMRIIMPKELSPLIFPLASFEKFESIVMPFIIEENGFENSKELIIPEKMDSVLQKSINNVIFEVNNSNNLKKRLLREDNINNTINHAVNKSTNIQDEILFSSDEENDCIHYSPENIPMTCTLKTSSYESEIDFNETIFVGFQTSSNKCIKVSKDSFFKAKNLFNTINKENNGNLIGTKIVDISDSHISPVNSNLHSKQIHIDPDKIHNEVIINVDGLLKKSEEKNDVNVLEETDTIGFETSNTKAVDMSEEALIKSKYILKDFDENPLKATEVFSVSHRISPKEESMGFKTASNKSIKISKESLAKSSNVFKDIDLDFEIKRMGQSKVQDQNAADGSDFQFRHKPEIIDECISILDHTLKQEFETDAVEQLKHEYSETNSNGLQSPVNFKMSKIGFKKSCAVYKNNGSDSFNDRERATNSDLCKNFDPGISQFLNITNTQNRPKFMGFKTANNKEIKVSSQSLTKTKNLFQDIVFEDLSKHETNAINNVISICNKFNDVKNFNKSVNRNTHEEWALQSKPQQIKDDQIKGTPLFRGFKTANNNAIKISKEALLKTQKIFQDVGSISICNDELPTKSGHYKKSVLTRDVAKNDVLLSDFDIKPIMTPANNEDKRTDQWRALTENTVITASEDIFEVKNNNIYAFKGFHTASNKGIKVSDEAITRSLKIFEELNFDFKTNKDVIEKNISLIKKDKNKENLENNCENEEAPQIFGFKTAANKSIKISEDSLMKSKQLFTNLSNNYNENKFDEIKSAKVSTIDTKNDINLYVSNTQLLNDFDETLYTEDFYKSSTPKKCKRSGSPILLCPKAKKRKKFETPYKSLDSNANVKNVDINKTNNKLEVKYTFINNYKSSKLYCLKDLDMSDENKCNTLIDPYILNFDFDILLKFEFEGCRNDFTEGRWTTDNIKTCFVESVNSKIIPDGWLENHLKLILWKLISYEIRFPNIMQGVCSVKNVLEQLKYRYDKELYRVERPALRKLLEKDDVSTKTMILAVVALYVNGIKMHSITNTSSNVELLLTDGWYCIKAYADKMISRLISDGKIAVGRKIATVGAELLNCEQGVSPWEDTSSVRLKLFGNSTRPARWDARLGYHSSRTIQSQLSAVDPSGGKVSKTRAFVVRVYPALYVEKLEDGSTVTRSERLEHLYQMKYETERQNQLEKLYEEVEREFLDQGSFELEGMDMDFKKSHQSGSQSIRLMKKINNLSQYQSHLTDSEIILLQNYSLRKKEKLVEELQNRVQDKMRERGLHVGRKVVPLLKIRVVGLEGTESIKVSKAMISTWRPTDAVLDVFKEGTWVDMFNVFPTGVRNSELQMSAGRQSIFHRSKFKETDKMKLHINLFQRKCFSTKDLNKNPKMHTDFNEIDAFGIVFLIEPSLHDFERTKGQQFQNVYLTDEDKNFICINFWGGIKKFGYENIFDTGNVVACMNLQKRAGNTRKSIPQYRATELTVFTKTPKQDRVRQLTEELTQKFSKLNKRKFCDDCIIIKRNYTTIKQNSEFSPYRFNNSDYSLTRNKGFIESPLAHAKDMNLNLTGLDFESTFKQRETQELSPSILLKKQLVKEKIAKLKLYGEPPPLTEIHIMNKSKNASSAYKSPLTGVITTGNKILESSPVSSLNRTFVIKSGVNPVKLNFSTTSVDNKMDSNPFEDEFEASPPLSLD